MKKAVEITVVCLIMTGLALVSTYPLAEYFTRGVPWSAYRTDLPWTLLNRPGDHLQLFYFFWLVKQNLLGAVPFNANPYEFNMLGGETAGNDGFTTAPLAFISFLFSPLGDITAYNCTLISSYVLAGLFMYLLARVYFKSRTGAMLAAVIFTFVPLRVSGIAGGHQFGFVMFMFPMIIYFMEKCILTRQVRYSILAGIGIVGLSFNELHLIYYFCLCMAGYLPFRFLSLLPANDGPAGPDPPFRPARLMTWPPWLSLAVIWGGGLAAVVYAHAVMPLRNYETFFSHRLWVMAGYYPFIPLFFSILLAIVWIRLGAGISPQKGLAVEAGSMLPLYLFAPMTIFLKGEEFATVTTMVAAAGVVLAVKLWLLRRHLPGMLAHVWQHARAKAGLIFAFSPVLLGIGGSALLTVVRKTSRLAPSTESGGRTLHDIRLYSAHFEDLITPASPIYTGWLPIALGLLFLSWLVWRLAGRDRNRAHDVNLPLYGFAALLLLLAQALSMGLVLGDRSLYLLFYYYVPFFNVPRVSDRILSVTILVLACVAAGVVTAAARRFRDKKWSIAFPAAILSLTAYQLQAYSFHLPMAVTELNPIEKGYQYLKDNIGDGVLLELPLWPGDSHQSSLYEYFTTMDRIKRVNGYTPLVARKYIETVFNPLHSMDRGELTAKQHDLLRRLNVKYITVHEHVDVFPPKVSPHPPATTVRRLTNSPYLEYVGPWPIWHGKYDKLHENVHIFKVREEVAFAEETPFYAMPFIYGPGSAMRQQTGAIRMDESVGREVFNASPGADKPGFMVYGPYAFYFAGQYRCYFRLRYEGESGGEQPAARIEAVRFTRDQQDILAAAEVPAIAPGAYQDYYLDFVIDKREQMEFRVFYYGTHEVSVDKVVVGKQESGVNPDYLEAELMAGETGRIVAVKGASGGKVIEASPGADKPGKMVYGPDLKYGAGDYSAVFYLKRLPSPDSGDSDDISRAAVIAITGCQEGAVFARQAIPAGDLSEGDGFTEITLDFTLAEPEEVSFAVRYTGKVVLQLDGVRVVGKNGDIPDVL